jgi:hypothetical protein
MGPAACSSVTRNVMASRDLIAVPAAWRSAIQVKARLVRARAQASFGAIAATATTGNFYGYSFGRSSRAEAERDALSRCNQQAGAAGACTIAIWFGDGCAALAIGFDGTWGADWADTPAEASAKALKACQSEDDSGDCHVVKTLCSQ